MTSRSSPSQDRAPASLVACLGLLLPACPAPPPEAPAIVVVPVLVASTGAPAPAPVAEPPAIPLVCPLGMAFLAGGSMKVQNRSVQVSDYCLDRREVTAADYEACVKRGACDDEALECDSAFTYKKPALGCHPINCVSWKQANQLCDGSGHRLPTFEEWEWAARSGSAQQRFPGAPGTRTAIISAGRRGEAARAHAKSAPFQARGPRKG
ncbi:formylglycine-generating enzyme family protein [Sorangium sp. So ce542]|uniref:formylglycine-generating enzyme family protein n=1 Tax=Sorangium sp. So ce542 TaxID=3133316 RepID=UPI003F5D8EBF